jgi:ABC-2 type transport system permease protein
MCSCVCTRVVRMLRSVATKSLHDIRRSFLLWSAGLAGMAALMVSVYPTVHDNPALNDLVKHYPDALKGVVGFGGAVDYATPAGYLGAELFSLMVPLLLIIATVAAGSGAVAGEEEQGTMELLLALPVSRRRLVAEKLAAMAVEVAGLGAVLWASLWVGALVIDMHISAAHLAAATGGAVLVAILFGAAATAVGAFSGRRARAIGITSAVAVTSYLINALAPLADALGKLRHVSPFFYYADSDPLRRGLSLTDTAVLVAAICAVSVFAMIAFERRDLAV